jgi:hypothetical protein
MRPLLAVAATAAALGPALAAPAEDEDAAASTAARAGAGRLELTVVSIFGDQEIGRCPVRLRVRRGPSGSAVLSDVRILDAVGTNLLACGDVVACREGGIGAPKGTPPLPWRGESVGQGQLELSICLDTCLGRFEGPVRLRQADTGDGRWRAWGRKRAVGVSGLELSGALWQR